MLAIRPLAPPALFNTIVLPCGLTVENAVGTVTVAFSKYKPAATGVQVNIGETGAVPAFVTVALELEMLLTLAIESALVFFVIPDHRGSIARMTT